MIFVSWFAIVSGMPLTVKVTPVRGLGGLGSWGGGGTFSGGLFPVNGGVGMAASGIGALLSQNRNRLGMNTDKV